MTPARLAAVGSAEATLERWPQDRPHDSPYDWLHSGNDAREHELRMKVVVDLARLATGRAGSPRPRLLHVGCADERFVRDVLPYASPTAVDPSPATAGAAAHTVRRGRFLASGATALPFTSETFDVVTLLGVIDHLTRSEAALAIREARRALKPGGRIVISARTAGFRDPSGDGRGSVRRFARIFDDFSDVEVVGLVPDFPTLRFWMAAPIVWRFFQSRVRTCAPADARTIIGSGLKR